MLSRLCDAYAGSTVQQATRVRGQEQNWAQGVPYQVHLSRGRGGGLGPGQHDSSVICFLQQRLSDAMPHVWQACIREPDAGQAE